MPALRPSAAADGLALALHFTEAAEHAVVVVDVYGVAAAADQMRGLLQIGRGRVVVEAADDQVGAAVVQPVGVGHAPEDLRSLDADLELAACR